MIERARRPGATILAESERFPDGPRFDRACAPPSHSETTVVRRPSGAPA